jgi:hypothetical protein
VLEIEHRVHAARHLSASELYLQLKSK